MTTAAKFWDANAAKYAKSPIKDTEAYQYTLDRTRSYLGAEDNVIEIGAGTGTTALELAPSVGHVTITDISPKMIEIGEGKAKAQGVENVEFHVSGVEISGLNGPYDAVLAHNVLHLVEDLPSALTRAHNVLKPGGLFISKTFCKPRGMGPALYYIMLLVLPLMKLIGKAPFVAFMTIEELEATITEHGFEVIESGNFPAKELRRYIVARRRP